MEVSIVRQFCNFLLGLIFSICLCLLIFQGFVLPSLSALANALLRILAAVCIQLLLMRTGRKEILRYTPLILSMLLAVWGFFLFLTSPDWQGATLLHLLADYVTPILGCSAAWVAYRKLYG